MKIEKNEKQTKNTKNITKPKSFPKETCFLIKPSFFEINKTNNQTFLLDKTRKKPEKRSLFYLLPFQKTQNELCFEEKILKSNQRKYLEICFFLKKINAFEGMLFDCIAWNNNSSLYLNHTNFNKESSSSLDNNNENENDYYIEYIKSLILSSISSYGYRLEFIKDKITNHLLYLQQSYMNIYSLSSTSLQSHIISLRKKGVLYLFRRDYFQRPNLYFNLRKYLEYEKESYGIVSPTENVRILTYFLLSYLIFIQNRLLIPGQIEQINVILDICYVSSLISIPKLILSVINTMIDRLIYNINEVYIVNSDTFRNMILVGSVQDYISSADKIKFSNSYDNSYLLQYVCGFNLQKSHGGYAEDLKSRFDYEEYEENHESTENISTSQSDCFFSIQEYESESKRLYIINKEILLKEKGITNKTDFPLEIDLEDEIRTPTKNNHKEKTRKYENDLSITSMSTSLTSNILKSEKCKLNYSSSPLCEMGSGDKLINVFNMDRKRYSQDSDYDEYLYKAKEGKDSIIEVKESLEKSNKSIKKSINFSSQADENDKNHDFLSQYTQKVDSLINSITTTIFNENVYLKK